MVQLRSAIRYIMLFLGLFEFYVAYDFLTTKDTDLPSLRQKHYIYPKPFIYDIYLRMSCAIFAVFLGLNRLNWATGKGGLGPWLCLVTTHSVEMVYLWTLAFTSTHYNTRSVAFPDFVQKVVAFEVGSKESNFILCIVPVLVFLSFLHGPYEFDSIFGERKSKED